MPVHPNSLKNLKPPFKPGDNRHNPGRPAAGMSTQEWFNLLWHMPRDDVIKVRDDKKAEEGKRWAAEMVLSRKGEDFDRIMDRTIGRPAQNTNLSIDAQLGIAILSDEERIERAVRLGITDRLNPRLQAILHTKMLEAGPEE